MADNNLRELYLEGSSDKPAATSSLRNLYLPTINDPAPIPQVSDTPKSVEELRTRASQPEFQSTSPVNQGYLGSVGEHAQGALDLMSSGGTDIAQGRSATGIGKLGLGAISYPLSPITGGLHEFVGKPASKIAEGNQTLKTNIFGTPTGGETAPNFGDKAELLAGSAMPLGTASRAISKRMPTNAAIEAITSSVTPSELADGLQRLKSNPELSVMDVFPSVKQMGQKLILTEGLHQNKFVKFIEDRIGGRKNAVEDIYKDTLGAPPNVLMKLNQLKSNIKDAGKEINPVLATAGPVDVSDVIANIDKKLKPGVTSVISAGEPLPLGDIQKGLKEIRKYLTNDKTQRIDAESLHDFQSAIRATADKLSNSPDGKDRSLAYHLMNTRNDLVNAIEGSAPGYKSKLAKYRDEYQVQDAFDKGYLITKNRPGQWDDRPEFWEQWIKGASKEEREAAREGARVAFNDVINGARGAGRRGMEIPETPFNRQKLELLFGKRETDEMASRLSDQRGISETNADMIKNSQTAMRMKSNSKVDLPEKKDSSANSLLATLGVLTEAAGQYSSGIPGLGIAAVGAPKLIGAAKHKFMDLPLARAKNERLTDMLTSTGEDRDALIQMLESSLPKAKLGLGARTRLMIGNP